MSVPVDAAKIRSVLDAKRIEAGFQAAHEGITGSRTLLSPLQANSLVSTR
jgi:hypothetical protein